MPGDKGATVDARQEEPTGAIIVGAASECRVLDSALSAPCKGGRRETKDGRGRDGQSREQFTVRLASRFQSLRPAARAK